MDSPDEWLPTFLNKVVRFCQFDELYICFLYLVILSLTPFSQKNKQLDYLTIDYFI